MDEIKILCALVVMAGASYDAPAAPDPQTLCVAEVVFAEARSESELNQALVASVVYNRSLVRGELPCDVAYAPYQFALPVRPPEEQNPKAWAKAIEVTKQVRDGQYDLQNCYGATYFHEASVNPNWAAKRELACVVETHLFYRKPA